MNRRGSSKVDAIKEALFRDNVESSRGKTQASKVFLVWRLANPRSNFQWKSQKRHLRGVHELGALADDWSKRMIMERDFRVMR